MHIGPRYTHIEALNHINILVGMGDGVDNSLKFELNDPNSEKSKLINAELDANMVNELIETLQRFKREKNIGRGYYKDFKPRYP